MKEEKDMHRIFIPSVHISQFMWYPLFHFIEFYRIKQDCLLWYIVSRALWLELSGVLRTKFHLSSFRTKSTWGMGWPCGPSIDRSKSPKQNSLNQRATVAFAATWMQNTLLVLVTVVFVKLILYQHMIFADFHCLNHKYKKFANFSSSFIVVSSALVV